MADEFKPLVSFFPDAWENLPTHDGPASDFVRAIKGDKYRRAVETVRERFNRAISRGVPYEKAKKTVDREKKRLGGITVSGVVPMRDKTLPAKHSGLMQADLDLVGDRMQELRETLRDDPHVYALFLSPTGEGLKALYRVPACTTEAEQLAAFAAVQSRVEDLCAFVIDAGTKETDRLCFASYDPDAHLNEQAIELPVMPPPPAGMTGSTNCVNPAVEPHTDKRPPDMDARRRIAGELFNVIRTDEQDTNVLYIECPNKGAHTTGDADNDCRVYLTGKDGIPTVDCFHDHCKKGGLKAANFDLRSRIGKHENRGGIPVLNGQPQQQVTTQAGGIESATPIARPIGSLLPPDDGNELLSYRYLCRGAGMLLVGQSGQGKSSLAMQMAIHWSLGRECFGIKPARALRILIIQAENDDGDLHEQFSGVCNGLLLSADERKQAGERILIHSEDSSSGLIFCASIVEPLAKQHRPDIIIIDPALAYCGGDSSAAKDVGPFLRAGLNPILHRYGCAAIVIHHTTKAKAEGPQQTHDFLYNGAGSIEWTNWARAVIALETKGQGYYRMHAPKRGKRIGWRDAEGGTVLDRFIRHSRQPGMICWHDADESEVTAAAKPVKTTADLLAHVPTEGTISKAMLIEKAKASGIGEKKAKTLLDELLSDDILHLWLVKRKGTNDERRIGRKPQPEENA